MTQEFINEMIKNAFTIEEIEQAEKHVQENGWDFEEDIIREILCNDMTDSSIEEILDICENMDCDFEDGMSHKAQFDEVFEYDPAESFRW